MSPDVALAAHERQPLDAGWQAASAPPGEQPSEWLAVRVPGTAASALRDAGRLRPGEPGDLDAVDWWFRTRFAAAPAEAGEEVVLRFEGLAGVATVALNGERILETASMFVAHEVPVGRLLAGANELTIHVAALAPLLEEQRKPRARWRTRLADGNLRFFRQALLGRAPGFAPGPAAVGPWRPIVLERRRGLVVDELTLLPRLEGDVGVLTVGLRARALDGDLPATVGVELGGHSASFPLLHGVAAGELRVPGVAAWWPHTHGDPALHDVTIHLGDRSFAAGQVGFRTLAPGPSYDVDRDVFSLHVNGVPVFARGAVWTPVDAAGLNPSADELRRALEQVRAGGLNILRIPGTSSYESPAFHDLCDELGILVWQDFMFANFDYPIADDGFRELVEREARGVLRSLAGRPSLAVLCGNSEVEQQVAMLGLDPALGRGELFGELLPRWAREAGADAVYVPSAPSGGELPFRFDRGVSHYFGVGGYRRPIGDARQAAVRFAAECLALANVPDPVSLEAMGLAGLDTGDARWKAGVARDVGTDWDFDDARDTYLAELFGVEPAELRRVDLDRYLELSRAVGGEVPAAVFGEWRRNASPCAGGIVLWLRDLAPGAGWGLIDSLGRPKAAYHHLRRLLAPTAVWLTDEGLAGLAVHIANDGPTAGPARLRIALYRDREQQIEGAAESLDLPAHGQLTRDVEGMLGRFVDASYAYRFGPPEHDVVVASLERVDGRGGTELLSQAFAFPAGRPAAIETVGELGFEADVEPGADGVLVRLRSRRLAYGVRIVADGFETSDDAFSIEPGGERRVLLRPVAGARFAGGRVTALNVAGSLELE